MLNTTLTFSKDLIDELECIIMEPGRFMQVGIYQKDWEKSKNLLEKIKPVSIIIMGNEFNNLSELRRLLHDIRDLYLNSMKIREPLIAIDQEGGNVVRLKELSYSPGNFALSRLNNTNFSYYSGMITGYELKELGFHWDLAPVVDVMNNSDNYIVMERSFGSDVLKVAEYASLFTKGLQEYGISATGKHFPGHGSVLEDSHSYLPIDKRSKFSIENTMYPFIKIMNDGIKSIMMSHIIYEAFDNNKPASLSEKWYQYVRKFLGYNGVIITDSLDMKAISNNFTPEEIAHDAFTGGADILECVDPDLALEIHEYLMKVENENKNRIERIESLYLNPTSNVRPPSEIMEWISVSAPMWFRKVILDKNKNIAVVNLLPYKYINDVIEDIKGKLAELGLSIKDDLSKADQLIIIGKNLHITGKQSQIYEICNGKRCIYINTGVPVDIGLINDPIGYISAGGEKEENILASIYSALGFYL